MWWEDFRTANVALWDLLRARPDIGGRFIAHHFPDDEIADEDVYGRFLLPQGLGQRFEIPRVDE